MGDSNGGWTRRRFLEFVGQIGGSFAVYETMTAMGWMHMPEAYAGPPQIQAGSGRGRKVLILGSGIGALTSAYELTKAGYDVILLEPTERAGGRSLTARRGDVVVEQSEKHGVTEQVCKFDPGLYLNMGPGRLPFHHRRVLYYCHELDVPLEVYVMTTTANLYQKENVLQNRAVVRRRLATDAAGYISELLAKQVCKGSLDKELTPQERKDLLELLVTFGDLNANGSDCTTKDRICNDPKAYKYCGSTRAGCHPVDVYASCIPSPPLSLKTVLGAKFWDGHSGSFFQPLEFEWQPTLFQPVGGMDKIVEGFKREIGGLISYRSEVKKIRIGDQGVEVEFLNAFSGERCTASAEFCISNIPLPILAGLDTNFTADYEKAVKRARFDPTCKVGWQANERFWESNQSQIYGGISYIDAMITQVWYPSNDYFSKRGTLTGAYNYEQNAINLGNMALPERLRQARSQATLLHPEFGDNRIVPEELGMSIAWQNIPFQRGGWANWDSSSKEDADAYARLLAPDRNRFFVVGDQLSPLPGWQEGAMMSAEHVVEQIGGIRPLTVPDIKAAPHTRRMVIGRQ